VKLIILADTLEAHRLHGLGQCGAQRWSGPYNTHLSCEE
jgi:hypothetical protein